MQHPVFTSRPNKQLQGPICSRRHELSIMSTFYCISSWQIYLFAGLSLNLCNTSAVYKNITCCTLSGMVCLDCATPANYTSGLYRKIGRATLLRIPNGSCYVGYVANKRPCHMQMSEARTATLFNTILLMQPQLQLHQCLILSSHQGKMKLRGYLYWYKYPTRLTRRDLLLLNLCKIQLPNHILMSAPNHNDRV